MEPIFAVQANRLSALGASHRVRGGTRRDRTDAITPVAPVRRLSLETDRTWETLRGELVALPEPISAPGWQGHRLTLRAESETVQVVTGQLLGPDGLPRVLSVGETLTIQGYRLRAGLGLVASLIERKAPQETHAPPVCRVTMGPMAESLEAPDGHYLLPVAHLK